MGRGSFSNSVGIGAQIDLASGPVIKFRMGARTGSDSGAASDKSILWPNEGINTSFAYNLCVVYDGVGACVDVGEGVAPMDRVGVGVEGNDSVKVKVSV